MKKLLCTVCAVVLLLACVACKTTIEVDENTYADGDQYDYIGGELNVLNWGEYIDEDLIALFEQETGVKVNYIEMISNGDMLTKMRSVDSDIDLCFPSDYIIEQMIREDMLQPLDMSKIPNAKNIDPKMMAITDSFDPGNKYSLPYMWGTVGILYNTTMVDEEVDSWGILWNEKYAGQVWMYDSDRDSIGITLKYLGYQMNTRNEDEINEAADKLIEQAPIRKGWGTDDLRSTMINGKAAMCVLYSGDALACMDANKDLAYVVPKEGSNVWFDNVIIPKTAKNVEAAHAFINFLNDGNLAARNTEYIYYSTPNKAAMDRLDADFTEDETYNPPQDVLDRCEVFHDLGKEFTAVFLKAWFRVKSSN